MSLVDVNVNVSELTYFFFFELLPATVFNIVKLYYYYLLYFLLARERGIQQLVSTGDKIVSIDLGWENSAYVCLTPELEVKNWRRVNLGAHQVYSPEDCYNQVNKMFDMFPFFLSVYFQ